MSHSMEIDFFTSPIRIASSRRKNLSPQKSSGKKVQHFQDKHRQLYKTPPRWLKNYRDKCISELSSRRQERQAKLIDNFRKINIEDDDGCVDNGNDISVFNADQSKDKIIKEVMKSVWKEMVEPNLGFFDEDEYHQLFFKQLELELSDDEKNYWNNFREQEEIECAIENLHSFLCFFCQKFPLSFHHNNNSSSDGLNPITEIRCDNCKFIKVLQYSLTPDLLGTEMTRIMNEHLGRQCLETIQFKLVNNNHSFSNIVHVFCSKCNFSHCLF